MMVEQQELKTLAALERAVVEEILRCEPNWALEAQWQEIKVQKREFFPQGVYTYFRFPTLHISPPAAQPTTLGGYTYARLGGTPSVAAFTLHTDEQGRLSHLTSFMDDDSAWPTGITGFEVFSVKRQVSPKPIPAPQA